jgi:hypothetical protein
MHQHYVRVLVARKINKALRHLFFTLGPVVDPVNTERNVVLRVIVAEYVKPGRLDDLAIENRDAHCPHLSFGDIGIMVSGCHHEGHAM